ncbi:TetR/AcrR family transcriptional regulator [Microbacterium sp. B24]|uniref:TetR/AcrR family transcriptional regulator n=1 Tax=Microbacterium sp. B24 TaxID=95616 RepID=UPI001EF9D48B|nr:TetR/AcrR family transcriptional regulator [Microbacterium sp. B24]
MSSGRPRATSRSTIAEAATELFLERGFAETTIAAITQRAGVSRSSFFNYFSSKSAVLWAALDEGIRRAVDALRAGAAPTAALRAAVCDIEADSLALAIIHGAVMGLSDELADERAIRTGILSRAVSDNLVAAGAVPPRGRRARRRPVGRRVRRRLGMGGIRGSAPGAGRIGRARTGGRRRVAVTGATGSASAAQSRRGASRRIRGSWRLSAPSAIG